MDENYICITAEESGERIDALLARALPSLSRSQVQKLLEQGMVTLNGRELKKNFRCSAGECYELVLPEPAELPLIPQNIPLDGTRMEPWLTPCSGTVGTVSPALAASAGPASSTALIRTPPVF